MSQPVGEVIAFCPKCNKSIGDQNPYAWCVDCGEPLTPEIKAKIPHLVQREQQAKETAQATRYNYQRLGDNWQQKSKEQLVSAAERLSTFTPEEEERIRGELRSRSMPEPGPTVRTVQSPATPVENMNISAAKAKLKPPAIAIIVNAGIIFVWTIISMTAMRRPTNLDGLETQFAPIMMLLILCVSAFSVYGAIEMMSARKHGFAVAISILAILSVCQTLIGFPIGIWALVVLFKPEIKSAFVW